jgi:hypothetical protein
MPTRFISNKVTFCVVGHSRSATGYMSALFSSYGYSIGHESVQNHGISSWLWAVKSPVVPFGQPRANLEIQHLLQVVRDPWAVVSSLVTGEKMDQRVVGFMRQYVYIDMTADPSAQAAYMVIGWNKLIQAQAPELVLQAEKAANSLMDWLPRRGYRISRRYKLPPKDYNTKHQSHALDLELMNNWPKGLLQAFRDHYQQYGYPVPELLGRLAT